MGIYTKYTLVVKPPTYDTAVRNRLSELSRYSSPFVEDRKNINGGTGCKWYECDDHAQTVAGELPDTVSFTIVRVPEGYPFQEKPSLKTYHGSAEEPTLVPYDTSDLWDRDLSKAWQ